MTSHVIPTYYVVNLSLNFILCTCIGRIIAMYIIEVHFTRTSIIINYIITPMHRRYDDLHFSEL